MRMIETIRQMGADEFARSFMMANCASCPVAAGCPEKWSLPRIWRETDGNPRKSSEMKAVRACMERCVGWLETDPMKGMVEL